MTPVVWSCGVILRRAVRPDEGSLNRSFGFASGRQSFYKMIAGFFGRSPLGEAEGFAASE